MSAKYEVEFNKVMANGAETCFVVIRKPNTTTAIKRLPSLKKNNNIDIDAYQNMDFRYLTH